jgi:hypothetical protein
VEVNIDLLSEKERNKILLQRARDAKKAEKKVEKEAQNALDKVEREAKKAEKAGKSKAVAAPSPPLLLTQTSTGSLSQNPRKRDASYAQLSVSRLQQTTSLAFKDCVGGTLHVHEFIICRSLQMGECMVGWTNFTITLQFSGTPLYCRAY